MVPLASGCVAFYTPYMVASTFWNYQQTHGAWPGTKTDVRLCLKVASFHSKSIAPLILRTSRSHDSHLSNLSYTWIRWCKPASGIAGHRSCDSPIISQSPTIQRRRRLPSVWRADGCLMGFSMQK